MEGGIMGRIVLIAAGLLLIGIGLFYQRGRQRVIKDGIRATALIRDYTAGPAERYFYVYEYTILGKRYTGTGNIGVKRISRKKIGTTEEIICKKDHPGQFVLAKEPTMAAAMLVLEIAGIALIAAGLFIS